MTIATAPTEEAYDRAIRRAREQFEELTGEHQMTVLHDDLSDMGRPAPFPKPYRHTRFAKPGTGVYAFDLVTWPGHLSISGDLSSFTFSRVYDMFDFFRGTTGDLRINPSYWGEKVIAGDRGTDLGKSRFSSEVLLEQVLTYIEDYARHDYSPEDYAALHDAVKSDAADIHYLEDAREWLEHFRWSPPGAEAAGLYSVSDSAFRFADTWEWDLSGYDHHFLLACHAIQWGIRTYLAEFSDRLVREVPNR